MSRNKRATQRQLEVMVNFIDKHRELIDGKTSPSFTPQMRDQLWEELTSLLNADICGPVKSSNKWRRSWIDIKCEAKARATSLHKQQNQIGKESNVKPLPPLLKKISNMISEVSEEDNFEVSNPVRLENIKKENLEEEAIETDGYGTDETTKVTFQNESNPVRLENIKKENSDEETIETDGCRTDNTAEHTFQTESNSVKLDNIEEEKLVEETIGIVSCGTKKTAENSFQKESNPEPSTSKFITNIVSIPNRSNGRWSKISKKTRDRASQKQLEIMVDFVNNHREMINRKFSTSFTAEKRDKLWEELTLLLNSDELGPAKPSFRWRRTWIDLKCEAKARAAAIRKYNQTGERAKLRPLTPLFEKIINIISQELEERNPEISGAGKLEYMKVNLADETVESYSNGIGEIAENLFQNESVNEPLINENITDTDSTPSIHLKSKHRFVSVESLTDFLEIEKGKVAALNAIAKEKTRANTFMERQLKIEEERNALYSRRTELFVTIANAFLEKF